MDQDDAIVRIDLGGTDMRKSGNAALAAILLKAKDRGVKLNHKALKHIAQHSERPRFSIRRLLAGQPRAS